MPYVLSSSDDVDDDEDDEPRRRREGWKTPPMRRPEPVISLPTMC